MAAYFVFSRRQNISTILSHRGRIVIPPPATEHPTYPNPSATAAGNLKPRFSMSQDIGSSPDWQAARTRLWSGSGISPVIRTLDSGKQMQLTCGGQEVGKEKEKREARRTKSRQRDGRTM